MTVSPGDEAFSTILAALSPRLIRVVGEIELVGLYLEVERLVYAVDGAEGDEAASERGDARGNVAERILEVNPLRESKAGASWVL